MTNISGDIPKNAVVCVAIIALVVVAGFAVYKDIDSGLVLAIATFIAGLAGYEIKSTQANKIIEELEKTIESLRQDKI